MLLLRVESWVYWLCDSVSEWEIRVYSCFVVSHREGRRVVLAWGLTGTSDALTGWVTPQYTGGQTEGDGRSQQEDLEHLHVGRLGPGVSGPGWSTAEKWDISGDTSHFSSLSSPNTGLAVHSISLYYIHSLQSTLYSLHTSYHTLTMLNMSHSYSNWRHKLHPHLRNVLSARLRDDICINKT